MRGAAAVAAAAALCGARAARGLDNGLARTPQMGYNSWYDLECSASMNETTLRQVADAMVAKGLVKLGYNYLNLDDCWSKGRNTTGHQYADTKTFPSGTLKELADYVHGKGMLFGTYTDRGTNTCAGRPGAQDHEEIDAQTYAAWGVDYLKEDSCHAAGDHDTAFTQYGKMRDALNATGRPVLFSLCGWNSWYAPQGSTLGNSWRIGPDDTNWGGVLKNIDIMAGLEQYAGPGGWNDPCLLLSKKWDLGARVTELQTRAQFSMWAVLAAPLLISGSVLGMSDETLATYSNTDVIAVSQDPLGKQGVRIMGGSLSGGGGDAWHGNTPAGAVPCSAADQAQQWTLGAPADGYLRSAKGPCLNVDNCGTDLIIWGSCPTTGCCDGCANMRFSLAADGTLRSAQSGSPCVVAKPVPGGGAGGGANLFLGECGSSAPRWAYDNATRLLSTPCPYGAAQCCLATGSKGAAQGGANVWARELKGGGHAVVLLNTGSAAADVTCGPDCFAQIGVKAGGRVNVRDVWDPSHHIPSIDDATLTAPALAAAGGHMMVIVTPA